MNAANGFSVRVFIPSADPGAMRPVGKDNRAGKGLVFPCPLFSGAKKRDGLRNIRRVHPLGAGRIRSATEDLRGARPGLIEVK